MKKRILVIGGLVVLVLLLAGAAFVGGKLMMQQQASKSAPMAPLKLVTPAAGMPTAEPDARGDALATASSSANRIRS